MIKLIVKQLMCIYTNIQITLRHKADTNSSKGEVGLVCSDKFKSMFVCISQTEWSLKTRNCTPIHNSVRGHDNCAKGYFDDTCFKVINRVEICIPLTDRWFGDAILHVVFLDEINMNFFLHLHNKFALWTWQK